MYFIMPAKLDFLNGVKKNVNLPINLVSRAIRKVPPTIYKFTQRFLITYHSRYLQYCLYIYLMFGKGDFNYATMLQ